MRRFDTRPSPFECPTCARPRYGDEGDYEPGNVRWITKSESAREMHRVRGRNVR